MVEFRVNNFTCCVYGVHPFQLEKQCFRLVELIKPQLKYVHSYFMSTAPQAFKVYFYKRLRFLFLVCIYCT